MRRLAACLLTALATVVASAAPASATPPVEDPLQYVAIGDSYSSASGVLPPDPAASPLCLRSTRNYPKVLAERVGAELTDVTCGGAQTSHLGTSQYPGVPPQLDALDEDTDLVTMTLRVNDSNVFIDMLTQCGVAGVSTLGRGSPCSDRYGTSFVDALRSTTYPDLVQGLRDVRAAAPNARIAITGYPWIVPASGGCFPVLPYAVGDIPYLRDVQTVLHDVIRRAAAETGATYVDLARLSDGRDACAPLGVRWVEPVVGTNPVVVHPNAFGESQMAAAVIRRMGLG